MDFPHGVTLYRMRAGLVTDPYSGGQVPGDWTKPTPLELPGSFVAHTSTSLLGDATRSQAVEAKSLYCDGAFDIQKGDRIFAGTFTPALAAGATSIPPGTTFTGEVYTIDGIPPAADTNPWTNWTPPREISLTRYVG